MADIPTDLPWDVNWDKRFEQDVEDRKDSGSFEDYKDQIITIIENPVREGRYKSDNLKKIKTEHVSNQEHDLIFFELTPGINDENLLDELEEVYFYLIDHWDNYGSALTSRNPVEMDYPFVLQIPYLAGGYDVEAVEHEVFELAKVTDGLKIDDTDWTSEHLEITGEAEPETRSKLDEILPDDADIEYNDPSPF